MNNTVKKVLIVGGGSAGFITAATLKTKLPNLQIEVLRSPQIGVIGVGEGTTAAVPRHFHSYLNVSHAALFKLAKPTWKLGIRFHWGPRPHFNYTFGRQLDAKWPELARSHGFYGEGDFLDFDLASSLMDAGRAFPMAQDRRPLITDFAAYHFDNETFVDFLEKLASTIGVRVSNANVERVNIGEGGIDSISVKETDKELTADLYIDASGFRSLLLGEALKEPFSDYRDALFCDRALVGGWEREDEPILPYTTADTMEAGWSWQIEHEHRINRGYVYSSDFITDEQAEEEFRKANPKITQTRIVQFPSGRRTRFWVKNVVGVGNAAGFVEPLEATSLAAICDEARFLTESLYDCQFIPNESQRQHYNLAIGQTWDEIRDFLAVHYKFNTRIDSRFWSACQSDVNLGSAAPIVEYYRENGPTLFAKRTLIGAFNQFGIEGYYALLYGQKVPFRAQYSPSVPEREKWEARRKKHREIASRAMDISTMLEKFHTPGWQPHIMPSQPTESGISTANSSPSIPQSKPAAAGA